MSKKRAIVLAAVLSGASLPTIALAQSANPSSPPVREYVDDNGVDLSTGTISATSPSVVIGDPASGGLTYQRIWRGGAFRDNIVGTILISASVAKVSIGGASEAFSISGANFTPQDKTGSTLSLSSGTYTYTTSDGSVSKFMTVYQSAYTAEFDSNIIISNTTRPDGTIISYNYTSAIANLYLPGSNVTGSVTVFRLQSVTSNAGYMLKIDHASNAMSSQNDIAAYRAITKVTGLNTTVDSCTAMADTCSISAARPSLTISPPVAPTDYTDALGRTTKYAFTSGTMTSIRRPGSATDNVTVAYSGGKVSSVTRDGVITTYGFVDGATDRTVSMNRGTAGRTSVFDISSGLLKSSTAWAATPADQLTHKSTFTYVSGKLQTATSPEGNVITYGYDSRGNQTSQTITSKTPGTPGDIVTSATYPETCTPDTLRICNKPVTTTDAHPVTTTDARLLNVTNYRYYPEHGGIFIVTGPASANGVHAETRNGYTSYNGIWRLTAISSCTTLSVCSGLADEVTTNIGYDKNMLLNSVKKAAGDGSVSATTGVIYNDVGDVVSVDGPLPGNADTSRFSYDAARQRTGGMGPDPDATGPLKPRAVRYTYNGDGQISLLESGNVPNQATDMSGFTASSSVQSIYGAGRKVSDAVVAGGTTYALTQYSYDGIGQLQCSAVRMDSSVWGSQADVCTPQTTALAGADRVTRNDYFADGHLKSRTTGYGTNSTAVESMTFTRNGLASTVTDANGNVTTNGYDGFDRLSTTTYPGGSYEQLEYYPAGNVASRRLRDGRVIGYDYDALGNRTYEHNPRTDTAEVDVSYSYDLFGRLLSASDGNGWYNKFEYDALGRATRQYSNVGDNLLGYDAAGRLTRQDWRDGFFVTYGYDNAGAMTTVKEKDALVLASYTYDDLGRLQRVTRGNGTTSTYGYDPTSRLASMVHDLAGTGADQTVGFGYNPVGQITSRTSSNDAYTWTEGVSVDRPYQVNALNQYTQSGSFALTYDALGNLTNSGTDTYSYNTKNYLTYKNGWSTLFYHNPLGQLAQQAGHENLDYVGSQLTREEWGGTVLGRYVYGADPKVPLVWYEGTGTNDRRWLVTDERSSVIAVTDGAGNAQINTYDEYGIVGANNQGRFQYTGQMWIPELGMYDFKARTYSPTLGRFLQTDPIGYGDGLNWHNYVGGDPINLVDPSGLWHFSQQLVSDPSTDDGSNVTTHGHYEPSIQPDPGDYGSPNFGGSGGGIGGGGKPAVKPPALQKSEACTGPVVTYSRGGTATLVGFAGVNVGVSANFSFPLHPNLSNPLQGFQFSLSLQGAYIEGLGAFGGYGVTNGVGASRSHSSTGLSSSNYAYAEADFGAGPAIGGSIQGNRSGVGGSVGTKVGEGAGAFVGAGYGKSYTYAFKPFGC